MSVVGRSTESEGCTRDWISWACASLVLHLISRSIIGDPTSRAFSPVHDRALGRIPPHASRPATDQAATLRGKSTFRSMHAAGKSCRWSIARERGLIGLSIGQAVMDVEQLTKRLRISPMQMCRYMIYMHASLWACILIASHRVTCQMLTLGIDNFNRE